MFSGTFPTLLQPLRSHQHEKVALDPVYSLIWNFLGLHRLKYGYFLFISGLVLAHFDRTDFFLTMPIT